MKKLTVILSVILMLAMCLTFAACGEKSDKSADKAAESVTEAPKEPGVKVGDTFTYADFKLIVSEITEGADEFDEAGTPEGKFVTIKFDADMTDAAGGTYSVEKEAFVIDGKEAADAHATMGLNGGSLSLSGMTVLFDVDKDADLDHLHLTVESSSATE